MRRIHGTSKCFFIFSLIGGVLLGVSFSLIPQQVSAYTPVFDSSSTTSNNTYSFYSSVKFGCVQKAASIPGSEDYILTLDSQASFDGFNRSACGWQNQENGTTSYYAPMNVPYDTFRRTYYQGALTVSDNSLPSYNDYSTNDTPVKLHSIINRQGVYINIGGSLIKLMPNSNNPNAYYVGHISFSLNAPYWTYGFQPGIDWSNLHLYNINNPNEDMATSDRSRYSSIIKDINDSVNFMCSDSFNIDNWIPSLIPAAQFNNASTVCSIFFAMPSVPGYYYQWNNNEFYFITDASSSDSGYNNWITDGIVGSYQDISYMFKMSRPYNRDDNPNPLNIPFDWSQNVFQLYACDDSYECDQFQNLTNQYKSSRSEYVKPNFTNNQSGGNFWDSWWNIFDISLIFPFRILFTSFTGDSCVELPIFASWLNQSSSHYCTWWPSSVRSTLTPVFATISLMVAFAFLISWLRDSDRVSHNINKTGGKE